ncbi:MAG: hypothetical protein MUE90_07955 [Thermoanaerobaculales bacterium]|nr:hypothetical protein [Thermoanaerobaculales bacterium]
MAEPGSTLGGPGPRGCLASVAGALVLAVIAPAVVALRRWQAWRRGSGLRLEVASSTPAGGGRRRLELGYDVPAAAAPAFRRRLTDAVVRVAELLRRPDDVYHLVHRQAGDEEAVALPLGPRLQALGERLHLLLSRGSTAGRTVLCLVLGRERSLAEIVDPVSCDPEDEAERERLLAAADHWALASAWVVAGPSLLVRIVLVVPAADEDGVLEIMRHAIS